MSFSRRRNVWKSHHPHSVYSPPFSCTIFLVAMDVIALNERHDFAFGSSITAQTVKLLLLFSFRVLPTASFSPKSFLESVLVITTVSGSFKAVSAFPSRNL